MPITVTCPCGKQYQVANEHAGKSFTCKACKTTGTVPVGTEQRTTPNERHSGSSSLHSPSTNDHSREKARAPASAPGPDTKPCPCCAETIKAGAKKCRFCGEILDGPPALPKPSAGFSGSSSKGERGSLPPELPGNRDAVERNGALLTFHTSYEVAYKTVLTVIEQTRLIGNAAAAITHNNPREGVIAATVDTKNYRNRLLAWAVFYSDKGTIKCLITLAGQHGTGDHGLQTARLLDRIQTEGEDLPVTRGPQGLLPPRLHEHPGIDLSPLSRKIFFWTLFSFWLFSPACIGWFLHISKIEHELSGISVPITGIEPLAKAKVWCYVSFVIDILLVFIIVAS